MITTAQFLEIFLVEQDIIETVITSMTLRKQLRSADSKLVADDMICCFLELRAYEPELIPSTRANRVVTPAEAERYWKAIEERDKRREQNG